MSTLMNIDPWGFLDDLFDTGSRTLRTMRARATGRFPPVNVYLDDNAVIIDLELPGKTAKDVYEYLGMSKSTWCSYMREPGRMDLEFISGVARCLNVTTVTLLTKEYRLVEIGGNP